LPDSQDSAPLEASKSEEIHKHNKKFSIIAEELASHLLCPVV